LPEKVVHRGLLVVIAAVIAQVTLSLAANGRPA